jgi:DnaJ-class molecular chaperone
MSDFRCPTCKGQRFIDHGDLVIFDDGRPLTSSCRTCGGTGVFVSRERAGLVCEPLPPAVAAAA